MVGWVYYPEYAIDYPVLKGDEYISLNINKGYSPLGSIFTRVDNISANSVTNIYGHSGIDGSMFGSISSRVYDIALGDKFYIYEEGKTSEYTVVNKGIYDEYGIKYSDVLGDDTVNYFKVVDDLANGSISGVKTPSNNIINLVSCYGPVGTSNRVVITGELSRVNIG